MMRYKIRVANGGVLRAEARGGAALGIGARARRREDPRQYESQLAAIRKLMRRALVRGAWFTLSEIAKATEFGEASISAQLRHLRKREYGGYRVQKRRRRPSRLRDVRRAAEAAMRNGRRSFGSIACCGRGRPAYGKSGGRSARQASEMKQGRRPCQSA